MVLNNSPAGFWPQVADQEPDEADLALRLAAGLREEETEIRTEVTCPSAVCPPDLALYVGAAFRHVSRRAIHIVYILTVRLSMQLAAEVRSSPTAAHS